MQAESGISASVPQVVKVSGGRSSGMMLLRLIEDGVLDPSRGDIAVFTNTSAEHTKTYAFLGRLKTLVEEQGLPFFWLEFCTYEDAVRGDWARRPAYRLVNQHPIGLNNPDGYRHHGEVFEEMLSHECATPSMQTRFCTVMMKVAPSNAFLADWFGRGNGPKRLGHSGSESRITDEGILARHKKNGGQTPPAIFLKKKRYVRGQPLTRPAQRFADFTSVSLLWCVDRPNHLYGSKAMPFVSHLGIRADEAHRIEKTRARIVRASRNRGRAWGDQPPGEQVSAPLVDAGIDRKAVAAFWESQDFDLELPADGRHGNCVFCMMKGRAALTVLSRESQINEPGPESIDWWVDMEARYGRDLIAEQRIRTQEEVTHFGFFGPTTGSVYAAIRGSSIEKKRHLRTLPDAEYLVEEAYENCDCTD